ncbi:MAG: MBL fold metallo-hydrolase, partial [Sulfitobacter sp.]
MRDPAFFTTSILRKPERLLLRGGSFRKQLPLRVRVGYFHHPKLGHTLVDTGYSTHVTEPGKTRDVLLSAYRKLLGPNVLYPDPLEVGLNLLGLRKSQIDTVVLTHFHADHVSGLLDLPGTQVICARSGWTKMQVQSRIKNATEGVFASLLPADIEQRLTFFEDFPRVSAPLNLGLGWDIAGDGNVLGIDLPGHLEGHIGLCF